MKKIIQAFLIAQLVITSLNAQNEIPATTVLGALHVNDSLSVTRSISSGGDIISVGKLISRNNMRVQKDLLVNGNAMIGANFNVGGITSVKELNVAGSVIINNQQTATLNPCDFNLVAAISVNGTQSQLTPLNSAFTQAMELALDESPCPTPPTVPFTWQTYGNHVNSNNRWIGTIENYDFNIRTNGILRMVVKNNGQVFIGAKKPTIAPYKNAALGVDGIFVTREVYVCDQVSAGWADYVFKKDYSLMPLKDVEKFTLTNSHLPNIPTAQTIKESGQNLGKLQVLQMEKIEEIYLYLFELNKKVDELSKENEALKQIIKSK